MNHMIKHWIACVTAVMLFAVPLAVAQEKAPPADAKPAQDVDPVAEAIKTINKEDNGITINAEKSYVDVAATVCLRRGDFLEMFACTKDTREHESILVIDAAPSQMHLGLLLLGIEPGKPLSYDRAFDPPKLVPAQGPEVGVFIVVKLDNVEREIPANRWVQDNKTEEMMQGNTWLFAGSQFAEFQDKPVYQADLNGSAISLVNFGDDLLTLPNKMTDANESHGKVWAPRTKAIPQVGTKVTIRLRPIIKEKDENAENPPPLPVPKPAE
ncbi:MAG: YdjY domain-containing protein [Phycisphaeraceae bacterium]